MSFSALVGLGVFATAFLAGITSVWGGLNAGLLTAGGLAFLFLERFIEIGEWYGIVSGILLIFTVIKNPDGLVGPAHAAIERRRQAQLARRALAEPEPPAPEAVPSADAVAVAAAVAGLPAAANGEHPTVLSVRELRVRYGGVVALDGASFDVAPGRIVGIIGPNGAGKTTLIDALCGFADYTGHVELDGRVLDGMPPHARARSGLGRTFQGIDLYEDLTVEENVMVGQHVRRDGAPDLHELLRSLGLPDKLDTNVRELSQGHRQLVSIARALAAGPRLLLLDEPAAGLDTAESMWLADRLRAVRDSGVAIVLVDHDMHLVLGLCDEIHVLDFGRQIAGGTPDEIRGNRMVAEAYLGSTHAEEEVVAP